MKGVLIMHTERLTWEEICKCYPNQQVALKDVELGSFDQIKSAVVLYSEADYTCAEINGMAARSGGTIHSENTSPRTYSGVGLAV